MPGEGHVIDAVESELGSKPIGPLEIVEQAPHEVAAYVHTVIEGAPNTAQDLGEIGDPLGVVVGGDATLRQEHRDAGHRRGSSGAVLYPLRPVLVTHLGDG